MTYAATSTLDDQTIRPIVLHVPGDARNILAETCRDTWLALPLTAARSQMEADALDASVSDTDDVPYVFWLRARVDRCYADWRHLGTVLNALHGETVFGGDDRSHFDARVQCHVDVISGTVTRGPGLAVRAA